MKINFKYAFLILLISIIIFTIPHFYYLLTHKVIETKDYTVVDKISRGGERYFTQGIFYLNSNTICESAGLYNRSKLITYNLNYPNKILQSIDNKPTHFAEGACILGNTIYQLTWREGKM
jgi:glutamine cyclotransferase